MPIASALQITLNSPESVELNGEFEVSIEVDSSDIFDIKIFVHKSDDQSIARSEYISEIYNDQWSDPWYYIKASFPEQKGYQVKVIESQGEREICARFRKTDTQSTYTECNSITILETNLDNEEAESDEETEEEIEEESKEIESQVESPIIKVDSLEIISDNETEKIILNSPGKEIENEKTISTKLEKKRQWILYSFTGLCIIIIILLALRRL